MKGGKGRKLFRGDEGVEFLEDFKGGVLYRFMIDVRKFPKWCHGFLKGWIFKWSMFHCYVGLPECIGYLFVLANMPIFHES